MRVFHLLVGYTGAYNTSYAWYVYFSYGYDYNSNKTGHDYVRCVRGGLSGSFDNLAISYYKLANIDPESDKFSIWMDITNSDGSPRTDICESFDFTVYQNTTRKAEQVRCTYLYAVSPKRYRVTFEIAKTDLGSGQPKAAYFENGTVMAREKSSGDTQVLTGLDGLSVYGTTFNMTEDAWSFANRSWSSKKNDSTDIHQYADDIASYIGSVNKIAFWDAVGTSREHSHGLCHGLAEAAIQHAVQPFKPFKPGEIVYESDWKDSAKKIMYYHVTYPGWQDGASNWVGRDDSSKFITLDGQIAETEFINTLLQKGRPGLMYLTLAPEGEHSVVITQLLRYNNHTKYMIWDNERPDAEDSVKGPYAEWYISDSSKYRTSFMNYGGNIIGLTEKLTGRSAGDGYAVLRNYWLPVITAVPGCGDTQNIYNLSTGEDCSGSQNAAAAAFLSVAADTTFSVSKATVTPDHLKVMLIGSTIDGVYNQATNQKVDLVPNGIIVTGQAVIESTMGGTFHLLYLPADKTYRVEATKDVEVPLLKVFVTIPNPDETVQQLNYEDLALSEKDATRVSFLVGRNNTNLAIQRTGGSAYTPDYNTTADMALQPPSGFAGYYTPTQVNLSWDNPDHPQFSLVKVIRRTDTFPTGPDDGTQIYSGPAQTAVDSTITAGAMYYYAAYAMKTDST